MKLEEQVNSLEISKHLKELGVKQGSLFYWVEYIINEHGKKPDIQYAVNYNYLAVELGAWHGKKGRDWKTYSAFTVAELFEYLGKENIYLYQNGGLWSAIGIETRKSEQTIADSLGKYLIELLENNLINKK